MSYSRFQKISQLFLILCICVALSAVQSTVLAAPVRESQLMLVSPAEGGNSEFDETGLATTEDQPIGSLQDFAAENPSSLSQIAAAEVVASIGRQEPQSSPAVINDDEQFIDTEPSGIDSNIETAKIELSPSDMTATAGHHYGHHHGHYVHGWLDMGAYTGKKGAFGWHDKHPVGGKGRR